LVIIDCEAGKLVKNGLIIDNDGDKCWYLNDQLHREDGPAIEYVDGHKAWYLNDQLHREDGPAIEYADGDKVWYLHGKCHRIDGPAREYADGSKAWYLHDKEIFVVSNEEFLHMMKLKNFW
jgi:hypothetical protein